MRYYILRTRVDFDKPREMTQLSSEKQYRSIGYTRFFYCTEKSAEKAKQLVRDFYRKIEPDPDDFNFKIEHCLWMKGITRRDELSLVSPDLTQGMFEKRNQVGIWYIGEKDYFLSEADYAALLFGQDAY
ncbi:MAG: hypothetical protein JXA79_01145 [Deltaproteobacteria bacterium]|nr:hypothetical protein [Deltaproteobacteria bacterium]